eukprot:m.139070 g.139070  ORF g.139070 m.139070 type:complete len:352 (-) comp20295_c0_seq8:264-1319(-)
MSCTICFIDYDEDVHVPHVLSCGHSLCGICLAFLPRRLCPNCSAPCGDNPPKNFSLLHILSQAPRPKIPDPHTMCKTHSEPLRFFDLVCDKLLCCDCFAVDHAGHQCLKIDEAAKAAAPEVKSLKEIARASASDVAQAEAKLERFLRDVEEKKKTLAASITETFAKVKATVQQRERALLLQLDIAALECSKLITKQKKKLKEVRGSLEASVAVPDQTSHAQLLQSRAHLLNTLETLKSAPPQLVPAHDGNLTFTHTLDEVHKSLSAFGAVSSGSPAKPSVRVLQPVFYLWLQENTCVLQYLRQNYTPTPTDNLSKVEAAFSQKPLFTYTSNAGCQNQTVECKDVLCKSCSS